MFSRSEKEKLVFNRLNFAFMIYEFIEEAKPKNMHELQWIIGKMIDEMQLCASDYWEGTDSAEAWEDVCTTYY